MPTVTIDPELYQRIQSARRNALPDTLVNEAVRRYLWKLDREKISQETNVDDFKTRCAPLDYEIISSGLRS